MLVITKNKKMVQRLIYLSVFIFSIAACGTVDTKNKSPIGNSGIDTLNKIANSMVTAANNCDLTNNVKAGYAFENDQFISNALNTELACVHIDSAFSDIKKQVKISNNQYSPNTVDTTVIFKVDCDSVSYISTKVNCFPLYLSIQSNRISFDKGFIKTGLKKDAFINRFKLNKEIPDTIKITEQENANEIIFIFKNGNLVRMIYQNLYVE